MIKITSEKLKNLIKNEKKIMLNQIEKIYETKKLVVSPLNFYVEKMVKWNQFDQLNIPLSFQLTLLKKEYLLAPEDTYDSLEESFLTKTAEMLQLRENLIPLFSNEDEFHESIELTHEIQWARKIYPSNNISDYSIEKLTTMKPTKYLMDKSKLIEDSWYFHQGIVKDHYQNTFFWIIEFEHLTEFSKVEIYENFNASAISSIDADFSGATDILSCQWESIFIHEFQTIKYNESHITIKTPHHYQTGKTKFIKIQYN